MIAIIEDPPYDIIGKGEPTMGNKPRTVVIAVSNTGRNRVLPASTIASLINGIIKFTKLFYK